MDALYRWCLVCTLASTYMCTDVTVNTIYGQLKGQSDGEVNSYLGIPYAKPPVDDLRWKRPVEPLPWKPSIYDATELKPGCPQHGCTTSIPAFLCPNKTSESCLYLNVWAPTNATSLPVMVYIHGGNFVHMSVSSPIYQGGNFVKQVQVVLVTLDYRLGALGFLYTGSSENDATGNYGIFDQKLALKWVQDNIKYFGGDPIKVTLFGQSAGGQSIPIHLMSPETSALFRNVIIESAPFAIPMKRRIEALYLAETVKSLLNCTGSNYMSCLRSKSADQIAQAQLISRAKPTSLKLLDFFEPLGPVVDGDVITDELITAVQKNTLKQVPTMIGTVSEEARVFVFSARRTPLPTLDYIALLLATYPLHVQEMVNEYPVDGATNDTRDILSRLGTDFIFTCATRNVSRYFTNHGQSVFRYVFDHYFSLDSWGTNDSFCDGHVCHGEEIPYVFNAASFKFDTKEEVLSSQMIYYFSNFAYTSDPNTGPHAAKLSTPWPKYDSTDKVMKFETPENKVEPKYMKEFCDFWDTLGYRA